jgi:hypothetical protein
VIPWHSNHNRFLTVQHADQRNVSRNFDPGPPCFRPQRTATPKASSFDRVVEDTLKAQIKR